MSFCIWSQSAWHKAFFLFTCLINPTTVPNAWAVNTSCYTITCTYSEHKLSLRFWEMGFGIPLKMRLVIWYTVRYHGDNERPLQRTKRVMDACTFLDDTDGPQIDCVCVRAHATVWARAHTYFVNTCSSYARGWNSTYVVRVTTWSVYVCVWGAKGVKRPRVCVRARVGVCCSGSSFDEPIHQCKRGGLRQAREWEGERGRGVEGWGCHP